MVATKIIINNINFPIYGIIIVLSVVAGMLYIFFSLKKEKYKDKNIFLFLFMFMSFSFIFGKIFTLVTQTKKVSLITAGLSSYGGLIGAVAAAIIFEKISPSKNLIIKYTVISLPLIYGLSKIACFVAGCCYGIPYKGQFSVIYPERLNVSLFPIQMVETISFLILFLICNKLRNNNKIIYITIILISIIKFLLDYLRYDHLNKSITTNQIFSIILLIFTIACLIYKTKNTKGEFYGVRKRNWTN